MIHSYQSECVYAPVPHHAVLVDGVYLTDGVKQLPQNAHRKPYGAYTSRCSFVGPTWASPPLSFLDCCRLVTYDQDALGSVRYHISGKGRYGSKTSVSVGVSYAWECLEICVGQFLAMNIPHERRHAASSELCVGVDGAPDKCR